MSTTRYRDRKPLSPPCSFFRNSLNAARELCVTANIQNAQNRIPFARALVGHIKSIVSMLLKVTLFKMCALVLVAWPERESNRVVKVFMSKHAETPKLTKHGIACQIKRNTTSTTNKKASCRPGELHIREIASFE